MALAPSLKGLMKGDGTYFTCLGSTRDLRGPTGMRGAAKDNEQKASSMSNLVQDLLDIVMTCM